MTARLHVGNAYVNRNQIGAIVGSQPFGGEGLSGTGPKAGGPHYLPRLQRAERAEAPAAPDGPEIDAGALAKALGGLDATAWAARTDRVAILRAALGADHPALDAAASLPSEPVDLPGPTGESNRLSLHGRGPALCLGADPETALAQALMSLAAGNPTLVAAPGATAALAPLTGARLPLAVLDGTLEVGALTALPGLAIVGAHGPDGWLRGLRAALAERDGPIVPLETEACAAERWSLERHLCIDTTAAGGNASLLASNA